ncbi:MAG: type I phosphomannose isomerase catalytic subunit [Gemmatimonadota bacterium]|nr:type I phosphomannose isomerase catalytic subunit [Gemmatimonadota bacterium]
MSSQPLYPMLLAPIFKDKIWGGRLMEKKLNKKLPPDELIGESWELSDYRTDITHVENGPLAGMSLDTLFSERALELIGRTPVAGEGENFPLLTKFIDSNLLLSLQVHPPDSYALAHDRENGKTECWYVVHAEPGATVMRGLEPGTTPGDFRKGLDTGRGIEEMVRRFEVSSGDFIFMPTGVVHAICEGTIILEIEQNSDMTYRLYDWGRMGADGKPRPTHIEKGMDVIDFEDTSPDKIEGILRHEGGNRIRHMVSCRYFSVEILELSSTFRQDTGGKSFVALTVVEGSAGITGEGGEKLEVQTGDTVLLPARPSKSTITPGRGGCKLVKAYLDITHKRFMEPLMRSGVPMEKIERHIFR